ncbi:hybrid sensor histidine kinase/response regulator [Aquaspirillum sp. LM1]|uniref:hybrid sensor histidine kinase/response regulator n=1 Tax=Aquaspirillum sp. LM1 TaxID=1938604 RepID=UPI00098396C3|nr:ATP-binding protein [Aquaspirillum sp. LM1]AQR65291.1 hybrid sensor histidine kinase/response regulator [Aquaspirillum sp. LM1]
MPPADSSPPSSPTQRIVKVRRDYNSWVARETLEDYALRFTPRSFRKWSVWRVANTAFGGASSFLVLEAIGATMLVQAGFINAFWAILATGLIIALAGLPISVYAARFGVDMDLLTRGAGFGYIGSTITSLIYASFTFIFFALEAAIMAYALEMSLGLPPSWGYLLCALVVIPLVMHGITTISRLQLWTQPLWLGLLLLPYLVVFYHQPDVLRGLWAYGGEGGYPAGFDLSRFGAALTVGVALITQMGEQADYLRFMPARTEAQRRRWWLAVLWGGPGWVLPGIAKMLGGALLAWLALGSGVAADKAVDPNQMYLIGFSQVFSTPWLAVWVTALFVMVSQLKINVTNAYAGSLAWSNFFARLTHSHPGRVVWMVFNILIALLLMELEVFQAISQVLGLYSNIAISWFAAVVADLVINKPLGLSPAGIEFRRAHLYDINPVGIGAMGLASLLSVSCFLGLFGADLQPFAPLVALLVALLAAPLIAWRTQGRYYLARPETSPRRGRQYCVVCERRYEPEEMSHCPAYQGPICSLCCSLDVRCDDLCKPHARLSSQWQALLHRLLPNRLLPMLSRGVGHYLLLMSGIGLFLALLMGMLYYLEWHNLPPGSDARLLQASFARIFAALWLVGGIIGWWMVLTHKSRQVAQEESNRQTGLLLQEIESHQRTDEQLQKARHAAEQANQAKSRYISAISHELRTPLNSILGYAQILDADESIPPSRRQAVQVIRRSGDHLLSIIDSTIDVARIESGKLTLDIRPLAFPDFISQIVSMVELQARNKGLHFSYQPSGELPGVVRTDEKRLRQILLNLLGNAVKFTEHGEVRFGLSYRREMAIFDISDTGPGIAADELTRLFEPFERGRLARGSGSGLGLTISKMLTDLMGGELTVSSTPGVGSTFCARLYLPELREASPGRPILLAQRIGYIGVRRRILIVDNEKVDRELLVSVLAPLGFELEQVESGMECLAVLPHLRPHLVFMDLAMPGLDGWETIRRIRAQRLSDARIAIISANAFERGQDNDVDIPPEDFILKPILVEELLDWIGRALQLEWVSAPRPRSEPPPPAAPLRYPPAHWLRQLNEGVTLGYMRGIRRTLDELASEAPHCEEFIRVASEHVRHFRLDALKAMLRHGLERTAPHDPE